MHNGNLFSKVSRPGSCRKDKVHNRKAFSYSLSRHLCVFFPDALFKKYQTIFFCCKRKKEKKSLITVGSPLLNAALLDDLHLIAVHMTLDSLSQGVCFSCTEGK